MASPLERYRFRKTRVREKISGTQERPRLSVYRSSKYIYAQIIDDVAGKTLTGISSVTVRGNKKSASDIVSAQKVGQLIAEKALSNKIKTVVFDRGGRIYHGVVKAVADAARAGGLEF